MVEIVVNVVLEVAKCLAPPTGRRFDYLRNYKTNLHNLQQEVGKLKVARDKLQRKVDDAEKNVEEIEPEVKEWQNYVGSIIDETEKLIEDKANNQCFKGLCPNFISRYRHGKEASRKLEVVAELLQKEEKFVQVSYRKFPDEIWLTSTKDYEAFESRNTTLKNILNALNDANIDMTGVYGMGGAGKTTLVKEVGRQVKKHNFFDEVVFIEVTETPDIEKIQEEIADKLGLRFVNRTERASKLYARLKNEKKLLVILDNVWADLDLAKVGIPCGDDHKGCKILLTARDQNVLSSMGSKTNFLVDVLKDKEAWSLFVKMRGDYVEKNDDLKNVAIDVVTECGGLPIAIITVAKALRNKPYISQWKDALRELRTPSSSNFEGALEKAYSSIELSYNYLKGEELKRTFLLCSLMANSATTQDLFKYGMGLGVFKGVNSMEEARDRVYRLVHELKDSCLLLSDDASSWFSMHDFVRYVAISIASRDWNVFTVRNKTLSRWPEKDTLEKFKAISLRDINISEYLEEFECPELEFFFMTINHSSFKIPDNFFIGMTKLRVLDLTGMELLSLPSSLQLLLNLRTLCLDQCLLGDISIIGKLKKLEILSFLMSDIEQLPKEIGQLTKLRLLDLTSSNLKVISPNVISCLSQLEELYMNHNDIQWEVEGFNAERSNASLDELKCLCNLTALHMEVKDGSILHKGFFSKKLERYNICIGDEWNRFDDYKSSRKLKIELNSNFCLKDLQAFRNAEVLCLDELQGVRSVLCELDKEGFSQLKHLSLQNSPDVLCIVDSMESVRHDAFPLLESLFLSNLINLEKICHDQLITNPFCKLKSVEVERCHNLKNMFSFSIGQHLQQLETIKVSKCQAMEGVFSGREDGIDNDKVIDEYSRLRSITLLHLPHLRSFNSSPSDNAQKILTTETGSKEILLEDDLDISISLFNKKVVFPKLEAIKLDEINTEKLWDNQLPTSYYQNLTSLVVNRCQNLRYVFSASMVKSLEQLQHLEIWNCRVLQEIVAGRGEAAASLEIPKDIVENEGNVGRDEIIFNKLKKLFLEELRSLKSFCSENHTFNFPSLEELIVAECPEMKTFCGGVLSTPRLQNVKQTFWRQTRGCWEGDLNTTIQQLHKKNTQSSFEEDFNQHHIIWV